MAPLSNAAALKLTFLREVHQEPPATAPVERFWSGLRRRNLKTCPDPWEALVVVTQGYGRDVAKWAKIGPTRLALQLLSVRIFRHGSFLSADLPTNRNGILPVVCPAMHPHNIVYTLS
jgi:hypothetical protein